MVLDADGQFLRAAVVPKENTLIPATERSAGRTSGAVAHPLCDKLRYVAADYGSPDHALYVDQLRLWAKHASNPYLDALLKYVERANIVADLVRAGVLVRSVDGKLESRWTAGPSTLAKLLTADPKTKLRDQGNALIRWRIEIDGDLESAVWKNIRLQKQWAEFNATLAASRGLCLNTGTFESLADSHPKRLRHGGDGAKLISANDDAGFTFRGRFTKPGEAYGLSTAATQKAHNALRWLIARQGTKHGDQVIVSWSTDLHPTPSMFATTAQIFGFADAVEPPPDETYKGDVGQAFALRLKTKIAGYRAYLDDRADVVVMALDSATPGRMAILYYRELKGSEFLDRIERWHTLLAWPQNFGKDNSFIGAPAPRDIAEAAYGRRVDEKLRKATVERLLPCIVDGRPLPRDLERATVARAVNRVAMERWEFERVLGIACSLVRATNFKEYPTMSLDEQRTSRDYLYGRLLAVADNIEELALRVAHEDRETNAARLMQRFADHPHATWRTLELQLRPYIARLRGTRAGALAIRQKLLDTIVDSFPSPPGEASSFTDNRRLGGEFLLGFHSQRQALRAKKNESTSPEPSSELTEGEDH